jgi:hypothetical protein
MAVLQLTGSVGNGSSKKGIPHNDPADVIKVRDRLFELGYVWVAGVTNGKDKNLTKVFLPFEGDTVLSIVLSKAFMLVDDDKITDQTILSQL